MRRTELEQVVYGIQVKYLNALGRMYQVDSTGISVSLYKAEVRWYRLSLSVLKNFFSTLFFTLSLSACALL